MKRIPFTTNDQLEGLRWAAKTIDFGVSLTLIAALNEVNTAYIMLRERKDLFRQKLKKLANIAATKADQQKATVLASMKDRNFFDIYSDKVIDLAEDDITKFRIGLKQTLDDNKHPDAELISYIEVARTMLEMAMHQFWKVIGTAREDFGGYPFGKYFHEFDSTDTLAAWEKVCDIVYQGKTINLNTERNEQLFNALGIKFAEGDYVDICLKEAMISDPEFKNHIITKDK